MEFVYKQNHVEDGIPAFRVNIRKCYGRYTGLSGSKVFFLNTLVSYLFSIGETH